MRSLAPTYERRFSRYRIVNELVVIGVLYSVYAFGRVLAAHHSRIAIKNADDVWSFERMLRIPSETSMQDLILHAPSLVKAANFYYATAHFTLTIALLLWLFCKFPHQYLVARTGLAVATLLGLLVHFSFPLAPPRMLPQLGFVDTGMVFGQSVYGPVGTGVANQFAAMPSFHVGWAVLVAIILVTTLRTRWRWLAFLHPALTAIVVVVTANHFWIDGVVGTALVLLGMVAAYRLHGAAPEARSESPSEDQSVESGNAITERNRIGSCASSTGP